MELTIFKDYMGLLLVNPQLNNVKMLLPYFAQIINVNYVVKINNTENLVIFMIDLINFLEIKYNLYIYLNIQIKLIIKDL